MSIKVGDRLPDVPIFVMGEQGPRMVSIQDFLRGMKVVLFGLPGAFTPTCHLRHVPGFGDLAPAMRAKGVERICCLSVNDIFVMNAWSQHVQGGAQITFLADGNADCTRALGMEIDSSLFGMGTRSRRYAMVLEDTVVVVLHTENDPDILRGPGAAGAEGILAVL